MSDFRSLAVTCLCRGEVETPRILLKQLAQQNGLNRILLSMYLAKCLEQGQPVTQLLQDIEADVDLTQFPGVGGQGKRCFLCGHALCSADL